MVDCSLKAVPVLSPKILFLNKRWKKTKWEWLTQIHLENAIYGYI